MKKDRFTSGIICEAIPTITMIPQPYPWFRYETLSDSAPHRRHADCLCRSDDRIPIFSDGCRHKRHTIYRRTDGDWLCRNFPRWGLATPSGGEVESNFYKWPPKLIPVYSLIIIKGSSILTLIHNGIIYLHQTIT